MPYDGYGGDESFPHDGKQGRCGGNGMIHTAKQLKDKKLRRKV